MSQLDELSPICLFQLSFYRLEIYAFSNQITLFEEELAKLLGLRAQCENYVCLNERDPSVMYEKLGEATLMRLHFKQY